MSSASDASVNKVALCSALVAGVAYVGYAFVRDKFSTWRRRRRDESQALELMTAPGRRRRVYLRRLSGSEASTSTEALLNTLDTGDGQTLKKKPASTKVILRPLSVQARIRELNVRARHFAEAVMAIQLFQFDDDFRSLPGTRTRSLTASPDRAMATIPILMPIDFDELGANRCSASVERLSLQGHQGFEGGKERSRRMRRSIRYSEDGTALIERLNQEERIQNEAERMLELREEELNKRLNVFQTSDTKILTPYEGRSLIALLHTKECETLEKVLITIANYSAFTENQNTFREEGIVSRLRQLLVHTHRGVFIATLTAINNLALNTETQKQFGAITEAMVSALLKQSNDDSHLLSRLLTTLTNVAVLDLCHSQMVNAIPRLIELLDSDDADLRLQSLRFLTNLSTNTKLEPMFNDAHILESVCVLLDPSLSEDELLRLLALIVNLCRVESEQRKIRVKELMSGEEIQRVLCQISRESRNEEVRDKARTLLQIKL